MAVFERNILLGNPCRHVRFRHLALVPVGTPSYGVAASSMHAHLDSPNSIVFRLWPSSVVQSEQGGDVHLEIGNAHGYDIYIPGRPRSHSGTLLGFCGSCGTTSLVVTEGCEPDP